MIIIVKMTIKMLVGAALWVALGYVAAWFCVKAGILS
jgi:hypothetical protein